MEKTGEAHLTTFQASEVSCSSTTDLIVSSEFDFEIYRLRFELVAINNLIVPSDNKTNVIRGAFGSIFKKLCCDCSNQRYLDRDHRGGCAYAEIFEPSPPAGCGRLSANHDIPRPFLFRASLDSKTRYAPGEAFSFELLLFGNAINYLSYFLVAFRELIEQGLGVGRARCKLQSVMIQERGQTWRQLYSDINLCVPYAAPSRTIQQIMSLSENPIEKVRIEFVTPTELKSDGRSVRIPEFHHVVKRLRDRINAIGWFYGHVALAIDFAEFGKRAERVRRVYSETTWVDRERLSSRTRQRHSIGGFIGRVEYEGDLTEFMPFLRVGEWIHVGKHSVWGNGQYQIVSLG